MAGMSHYYAHVVQMTKMLKQLVLWMDKAETHAAAKKFDVSVLLDARLAPDMYSLRRQIQNACDGPKFLAARLAGTPPPKHEDGEQSWSELRARASSVIEYLGTFKEASFADSEARMVPLSFMPGKGLRAIDFLTEMNLPNTYFHLSMTYAILRHNGVDVGKMDFLGSLAFRDL
jgi:hypothetical protein